MLARPMSNRVIAPFFCTLLALIGALPQPIVAGSGDSIGSASQSLAAAGLAEQVAVTNVTAAQRADGSNWVDIGYTLSGATEGASVSVLVSRDNGESWEEISAVSGDVGPGISDGARAIVWNAGAERPGELWPSARIEVRAAPEGVGAAEITVLLPGDVPLILNRIPAGSFVMGSPDGEASRLPGEGPQTSVTISRDFFLGRYEVTQAQWAAVMGSNPSSFPGRPNNPVEQVSWNDAQDFITVLNAHLVSSGQGPASMRLPTEAEWEYAVRAGTTTRFYFGDSLLVGDFCEDDGVRSQYMWYCGNSNAQSQPVGQKLPNPFGLYDMSGNVWEWCQDWASGSLPGGTVTDPAGPPSGSTRVARGGSWSGNAYYGRSAEREESPLGLAGRSNNQGFRLASNP